MLDARHGMWFDSIETFCLPSPTVPAVALHTGNQSPTGATSPKILVAQAKFYLNQATRHPLVSNPANTSKTWASKIIVGIGQYFHPLTFCRMNYGVAFLDCFHRQLHFREALKKESIQLSFGPMKKMFTLLQTMLTIFALTGQEDSGSPENLKEAVRKFVVCSTEHSNSPRKKGEWKQFQFSSWSLDFWFVFRDTLYIYITLSTKLWTVLSLTSSVMHFTGFKSFTNVSPLCRLPKSRAKKARDKESVEFNSVEHCYHPFS